MAASRLRGAETPSLAASDLLHETLVKLMEAPPAWQDRAHFFATVSRAMRSVLVDHARARQTDKRGGAWQRLGITLSDVGEESNIADLLTLNQLLDQLAALDPRAAEVLQLTYFGGLQRDEIASVLDLSVPTIDRGARTPWPRRPGSRPPSRPPVMSATQMDRRRLGAVVVLALAFAGPTAAHAQGAASRDLTTIVDSGTLRVAMTRFDLPAFHWRSDAALAGPEVVLEPTDRVAS